jgi:hypothetical protein
MSSADVVYKVEFGDKVFSTSICRIEIFNIRIITNVKGATDVSFSHVSGTNVDLEVPWFGKFLVAAKIGARYLLSLLQRLSRMLTVNVVLQLSLTGALQIAERTIGMLLFHVRLKLGICSETEIDRCPVWAKGSRNYTLRAEELGSSVDTLFVLAETNRSIKSSIAGCACDRVDIGARIWRELKMFGADMALECLMLPEGLIAWWVSYATESLMTFMCLLVSLKTS